MIKYYYTNDERMYRGIKEDNAYYKFVDTTGTQRMSRNTENYYTLVMNNASIWKDYPKRNIICANEIHRAGSYAKGQPYLMFPFDGQKIGISPTTDIWDSFKFSGKFGEEEIFVDADSLNYNLNRDCRIYDTSWEDMKRSCEIFDESHWGSDKTDDEKFEGISRGWFREIYEKHYKGDMLKFIIFLFSPHGHRHIKVGEKLPDASKGQELWCDGKVVMVRSDVAEEIIFDLGKK